MARGDCKMPSVKQGGSYISYKTMMLRWPSWDMLWGKVKQSQLFGLDVPAVLPTWRIISSNFFLGVFQCYTSQFLKAHLWRQWRTLSRCNISHSGGLVSTADESKLDYEMECLGCTCSGTMCPVQLTLLWRCCLDSVGNNNKRKVLDFLSASTFCCMSSSQNLKVKLEKHPFDEPKIILIGSLSKKW